jgi:hypothetical protein
MTLGELTGDDVDHGLSHTRHHGRSPVLLDLADEGARVLAELADADGVGLVSRLADRLELAWHEVYADPSVASAFSGLKNTRSATTASTVSSGRSTCSVVPSSLCSTGTIA